MKRLGVLLLTYDRLEYAIRTLETLQANLDHPDDFVHLHIADDGSPEGYLESVWGAVKRPWGISVSVSGNGYGASYNLGTQQLHPLVDAVLPLEDDWALRRQWTPQPMLEALGSRIGCIRLGYLGWTQELRGDLIIEAGEHYLRFDPESPERHVCAGHPRLEDVQWARNVGPWVEGKDHDPGSVEFEWCGRKPARRGVAWPLAIAPGSLFAHIGTHQARSDQREVEE